MSADQGGAPKSTVAESAAVGVGIIVLGLVALALLLYFIREHLWSIFAIGLALGCVTIGFKSAYSLSKNVEIPTDPTGLVPQEILTDLAIKKRMTERQVSKMRREIFHKIKDGTWVPWLRFAIGDPTMEEEREFPGIGKVIVREWTFSDGATARFYLSDDRVVRKEWKDGPATGREALQGCGCFVGLMGLGYLAYTIIW